MAERGSREFIEATIRNRAFSLVYQPIVDLETDDLLGVEALCRFHDGRSPDVWFDRCETLGLAVPMDLAVLELAIDDLDDLPDGYLALNLSISTLLAGDGLLRALRPAISRRRVMLELSERVVVRDYEVMRRCLAPLRDAGVLIAVDDAGAGYSSIQHIVRLRPDVFKVDRSFISSIDTDDAQLAFAIAAAVLGDGLGCDVVAEGVETASELETVRAAGISAAQGYYLGRPSRLPLPIRTPAVLDLTLEESVQDPSDADLAAIWARIRRHVRRSRRQARVPRLAGRH